jgi:hypothetical protein
MLSSAQLTAFQAAAASAMEQSIQIKRATPTPDTTGHASESYSAVVTVNGNLSQPTGGLLQNYDYLVAGMNTWMVRVPVGTNLLEDDRLIVAGKTMRVMVILQPQSYQTSMRALAAELQGETV